MKTPFLLALMLLTACASRLPQTITIGGGSVVDTLPVQIGNCNAPTRRARLTIVVVAPDDKPVQGAHVNIVRVVTTTLRHQSARTR
jgi:hypothetical protein